MSDKGNASNSSDVLIIGAGISGLCAARDLQKRGYTVRVLEARERVGGRTYSVQVGKARLDLGAQWVGKTQTRVLELAEELGIATFPTYDAGHKIIEVNGKVTKYSGDIPSLSILNLVELQFLITRINRLCKHLDPQNPQSHPKAGYYDGMTVETWKRRNLAGRGVQAMFDIFVRAVFAAEPREMSMLYFLTYIKAGGDFNQHAQVRDGAQEMRLAGGTQQLSEKMAAELKIPVVLGAPARSIEWNDQQVRVETDITAFTARKLVIAVSPILTLAMHFQPMLSMRRVQLIQRMPIGSDIKCIVAYDRPFWRDQNFAGQAVSDEGIINFTYDNTSFDDAQASMVAFITGDQARKWGERSQHERRKAVLAQLAKYFGDEALSPTHFVEQNWNFEAYSGGCPVGMGAPGTLTEFGNALREPVGPIHWAATETATRWCGFMDGAIESGHRAAEEIAGTLSVDAVDAGSKSARREVA